MAVISAGYSFERVATDSKGGGGYERSEQKAVLLFSPSSTRPRFLVPFVSGHRRGSKHDADASISRCRCDAQRRFKKKHTHTHARVERTTLFL